MKCDKGRVYIWQRPCLYKCGGGRSVIYKPSIRLAHTMGLVASCELAIFATKSSRRDQNFATSPTNSNWFDRGTSRRD